MKNFLYSRFINYSFFLFSTFLLFSVQSFFSQDLRFKEAVELAQAGKLAEAEKLVRSALEDQSSPDGYRFLGYLCESQEKLEQAERAYQKSLQLNPNLEFSKIRLGIVYCKGKKYLECFDILEPLESRVSEIPEALFYLCEAFLEKGDRRSAVRVAQVIERTSQINPEVFLHISRLFIVKNLYQESIPLLNKSVAGLPRSAEAYYLLSFALFQTGRIESMRPILQKALVLAPDSVPALLLKVMSLLELTKLTEAKQTVQRILKIQPGNPKAAYLLGKVRIEQGNYAEAIEGLTALIERFSMDPDVHLLLLSAYRNEENYQKAFDYSLMLAGLFPNHPLILYNAGLDLEILGRFQEGESYLRKTVALAKNDPKLSVGAKLGLARVLTKQEKHTEAVPLFEEAIRGNQGGAPARQDLSDIYFKTGEYEKALKLLREVVTIAPKKKEAYIRLAKVLRRLGRNEEARKQVEVFQQLEKLEKERLEKEPSRQDVRPSNELR